MAKSKSEDLFSALEDGVKGLKAISRKARAAEPRAGRKVAGGGTVPVDDSDYIAPPTSRCSRGWSRCGGGPACMSGGTDENALHHLFAEVMDNAMDEAVAGHATFIEVDFDAEGFVTVTDNGRGMPVDRHPKFKDKSALEVIMTMLHSGGKFDSKAYETSGGLHGVGVSVVNALSDALEVEVARGRKLYRQEYSRGKPTTKLKQLGDVQNRRGTKVRFRPDPQIFGKGAHFKPDRLFRMSRSKAYLFGGVEIRWKCDPTLVAGTDTPAEASFHFPGGLRDYLTAELGSETSGDGGNLRRDEPARPPATAPPNGRLPGFRATDFSVPTATRSRRARAARTRRDCATR